MKRIGMKCDEKRDFFHLKIPKDHPLAFHVFYVLQILRRKLSSKNNILLGLDADNKKLFVENNNYRRIILIAPHGSGKGVYFVISSFLAFEEFAICL